MKDNNNLPIQMIGQGQPFNSDTFIQKKVLELKEKFNIKTAVETGTHFGYTTMFLAENFDYVITIESDVNNYMIALRKCIKYYNICFVHGFSQNVLFDSIKNLEGNIFFFLDAHWHGNLPLLNELNAISKVNSIKPIIAIHDILVPNSNLGYDTYNNIPISLELIKTNIDLIYGVDNYNFEYNNEVESEGAKRGIIYIY